MGSCIALARSLVIKSEHIIEQQNDYLESMGYVISTDPRDWKYYLNLSGMYHPTDTPVTIISSDTKSLMRLDAATLADHPITRAEYGPGGIYHRELITANPANRGVLVRAFWPVDVDVAIAADDFTILYHDPAYIGASESGLIRYLNRWLKGYSVRWNVPAYMVTDPLYLASMYGILYIHLPNIIAARRVETMGTLEVSTWHMAARLASEAGLDKYMPYLSNDQLLFLYRNIRYIRYNVGKASTLDLLVKHIVGPSGLTLSRYDLSQDESALMGSRKTTPVVVKQPMRGGEKTIVPLVKLYQDLISTYPSNAPYVDEDLNKIQRNLVATTGDSVPTGIIDVTAEYSPLDGYMSEDSAIMMSWGAHAGAGLYPGAYPVQLPQREDLMLTTADGFVLMMYISLLVSGGDVNTVVPPLILPTAPSARFLNGADINAHLVGLPLAEHIASLQVVMGVVSSPADLTRVTQAWRLSGYKMHTLVAGSANAYQRSRIMATHDAVYPPVSIDMVPSGTTYVDWAAKLNVSLADTPVRDLGGIALKALKVFTGLEITSDGIKVGNKRLVELLRELTSYGLIFNEGAGLGHTTRDVRRGSHSMGTTTSISTKHFVLSAQGHTKASLRPIVTAKRPNNKAIGNSRVIIGYHVSIDSGTTVTSTGKITYVAPMSPATANMGRSITTIR